MAKDHPHRKVDKDYYRFSGTSMSAAQVSGVVALMLARDPSLTPDQVKYRLMASARPAATPDGLPAASLWQQGAGRVDAYAAVYGVYAGEANQGLDIEKDLAGLEHYVGYTRWDNEAGRFYLLGSDGYVWGGGFAWSEGYVWGGGFAWSEAYLWGGGFAWSENYTWGDGFAWSEGYLWGGGFAWSEATASIDLWVPDE
jgi:serine protease AprX